MGEKGRGVISSSVQHLISLIFAIHVSSIIPLPMMWILLTKPMQKFVTTVCSHCSFARLKNKHRGVLGTNVAANKLATLVPSVTKVWKSIFSTVLVMSAVRNETFEKLTIVSITWCQSLSYIETC